MVALPIKIWNNHQDVHQTHALPIGLTAQTLIRSMSTESYQVIKLFSFLIPGLRRPPPHHQKKGHHPIYMLANLNGSVAC